MTPTSTLAIVGYCVLALVVAYVSLRLIRLYRARNASSRLPIPVSASSSQSISGWARSTAWSWAKWSMPWSRNTKSTPTPTKAKGKSSSKSLTVELLPVTAPPPHPSSLPATPPLVDISSATSPSRPASAAIKHHNIPHPSYPRPPSPHALLATTTPSKHRRSRSLGGVPVRRLSGGTSSSLRYANQVEVEMRDMGLRERDAIASRSSNEHLLIDFSSSSSEEGLVQEPRRISPAASDIGVLPAVSAPGGSVVGTRPLPLVYLGDEESVSEGWNWQGPKRSLEHRFSPSPRPLAEAKLVDLQSSSEDEDEGLVLPPFNRKSAAIAFAAPISVNHVVNFPSTRPPLRLSKSESSSPQLVDVSPDDPFADPPLSQMHASVSSTPSTVVLNDKAFVSHPLEDFMEPEIVLQHEDVKSDGSLLMQVDQDNAYMGHPEDLEAGAQDPFVDVESSKPDGAADEEVFHYPSPVVEQKPSVPISPQSDDEEFHYPGAETVLQTSEAVRNEETLVDIPHSVDSPASPSEFVYPSSEGTLAWAFDNEHIDDNVNEDPWANAISAQWAAEYAEEGESNLISFGCEEGQMKLEEKSPGGSLLPLQGEDEDEVPVLVLERSTLDVQEVGGEEEETDTTPRPTPSSTSADLPEADSVGEDDAVPATVLSPKPGTYGQTFRGEAEGESIDEEFPDPELLPLPALLLSTSTIPEAVDALEPAVPAISIQPCDQDAPASVTLFKAAGQTPTPPDSPPSTLSPLRVLNPQHPKSNSANSSPRLGIKHSFSGGRSLPPSPRIHVRNVDLLGSLNIIPSPVSIKYSKSLPLMESSSKADDEKENISPGLQQRPLWSLRAADAPALGLKAEGSRTSPMVRKRALEREREDAAPEQREEKKELHQPQTKLPVEQLTEMKQEVEVEPPAEIKASSSLPGSFPDPTVPAVQDVPTVDTVTRDAATATANLALAALTLLSSAASASSSSTSTSGEDSSTTATQPRQPRARLPTPRSTLDIALAMQLRPGLGAGADPAWMVRFLMAMYGWFGLLISGQGNF